MRIGVLAIQGDFAEHIAMLQRLGVEAVKVRLPKDLEGIDGLILPGGESTTLGIVGKRYGMLEALQERLRGGLPVFGTCAGTILLARHIVESDQPRLGVLDIVVNRNAYGRQKDSFEAPICVPKLGEVPVRGVFIRAPIIESVGAGVEVLAELDGKPVLVQQDNILASTFHPELTDDLRLHRYFVQLCRD
ncbi:Pyridoxal 5'-phosphate synthase subunit PdxT [bacterium HR17]|uniref:Pyridoxal 5'-phosphate synthase subunit PdxT n=1 Tax=Candidatus Fervidibacter japonicus TaxID=2035412 RepID=A0A2H5XG07_9BACT|nr:Pyridoxal 5'-phosphate synthase subunit PdxT [bacterium HR17]